MASWTFGRGVAVLAAGAMLLAGCGSNDGKSSDTVAGKTAGDTAAAQPSGNGVAQLDGAAILTKARAAIKAAPSYRMKGSTTEDKTKIVMDFKIRKGGEVIGSMSVGAGSGTVQVLKVAGKQYVKPDNAFWKKNVGANADAVIRAVHGRWVVIPASNKDFSQMFTITDIDSLLDPQGDTVTKGATGTVAGKPAISLKDSSGEGALWIATTGQPYPLRLDGPTAADGNISFTDFGATFSDLKAPAAADVVDFDKLHG